MPEPIAKAKAKKQARTAAMTQEKRRLQIQRSAAQQQDLLEKYAAFKSFSRGGVDAKLEGVHGDDLCEDDVAACIALQQVNSGDIDVASSHTALKHKESRIVLMRSVPKARCCSEERLSSEDRMSTTPDGAPDGDDDKSGAEFDEDEWDLLPEVAPKLPAAVSEAEAKAAAPAAEASEAKQKTKSDRDADRDDAGRDAEAPAVIGYMHLQFCPPLLCVLNMQLAPSVMGKGLGKFALQLVELMARQLSMELVTLQAKDGKLSYMRLSKPKLEQAHAIYSTENANAAIAASDAASDAAKPASDGATGAMPPAQPASTSDDSDEAFEIISKPPSAISTLASLSAVAVSC